MPTEKVKDINIHYEIHGEGESMTVLCDQIVRRAGYAANKQ